MQYRKCENSTRAPGRVGDAAEAFVLAERLHDFKDPGRCRGAGQGCPKRLRDRAKLSFFAIGKIYREPERQEEVDWGALELRDDDISGARFARRKDQGELRCRECHRGIGVD